MLFISESKKKEKQSNYLYKKTKTKIYMISLQTYLFTIYLLGSLLMVSNNCSFPTQVQMNP